MSRIGSKPRWAMVVLCCALTGIAVRSKAEERANKPKVTYQDDLAPLLRESCFGCHNQDKAKGGLNLMTFAAMMQGGSSGNVIEPGDPKASYLFQLVTHESEPHMPLNSAKLPDEKVAIIRRFIEDGALESSGSTPQAAKKEHAELKLSGFSTNQPDGPMPMPPRLPLEPVLRTERATAITALAASPWAPVVAVSGQQQVLLYNTDTLQLIGVLPFPEGVAHVLRFSRNGKILLAGGGHEAKSGRVVLWDITTGKRITEIGDEFDVVLAADISPDQSLVALGGPSKVVRIFSTVTGELQNQIKKHTDWITALQFSPDNVLLATGDRNGEVFVWEAAKAQEYLSLRGHTAGITGLNWRADGNLLASCSDDTSVRLWEMENGKQIKTWNAHGGVQWVEFCRDGRLVTCGRDHQVKLWSGDGKQQGKDLPLPDIALRVVSTPDSSRLIGGDWTGEVRVWNVADGKQLGSLSANPPRLEELLDTATRELSARQSERERLVAAAESSNAAAEKSRTDLSNAQCRLDSTIAAEKAGKTELIEMQNTVDQTSAEVNNLKVELSNQESALAALVEAVAKAQTSADKLPGDMELSEAVLKLQSSSDHLSKEVAATNKSLDDKTRELTACQERLTKKERHCKVIVAAAQSASQQIEGLTAAVKTYGDKATADNQAADRSAAVVHETQAEVQHWTEEIEFAKSAAN